MGPVGMVIYMLTSAVIMALAIPLQFIDLILGILYPVETAFLLLVGSKALGATFSYLIANNILSKESKEEYKQNKYFRGVHDLIKVEPLKYGLLIRFASIPIILRNYGLALMPINYTNYILCVILQSLVTSPLQAYAGSQFPSIIDMASN